MPYYSFKIKQIQLQTEKSWGVTDLDKPINGTAVHKGREHPAPGPEGLSHRAHAENNVQLLADSANKVLKHLPKKKEIIFQFKIRMKQQ